MEARQERGLDIANVANIERHSLGWKVPSQSGKGAYIVNLDKEPICTCPDFETRRQPCKHIYAVEFVLQREVDADGSEKYTESVRVTYRQEWTAYNKAQTNEEALFVRLLQDLCDGIPQPIQTNGRPRLPLNDVVFALAYKVYSTMSGRRFTTALNEAQANGLINKAPHYNSAFRYLEAPELTPLLKALIAETAKPLQTVETDFAVDSTGFATSTYARWFDHKYGKERSRQTWVKCHVIVGTQTHTITSIEATPTESNDGAQFPGLVQQTAQHFEVNEVSGDKAYSTKANLKAVQAVGGTAFIPFKNFSRGTQGHRKVDTLWERMWAYYQFNRPNFLQHYHKRSNVETAFSMMKAKFGGAVRSKTPTAQVNEVLAKALCHNVCVLIQSIYELGLEPVFWTYEAKSCPAPKLLQNIGF